MHRHSPSKPVRRGRRTGDALLPVMDTRQRTAGPPRKSSHRITHIVARRSAGTWPGPGTAGNGLALSRFNVIYVTPPCVITPRSPVQGSRAVQEHLCLTRPYVSKQGHWARQGCSVQSASGSGVAAEDVYPRWRTGPEPGAPGDATGDRRRRHRRHHPAALACAAAACKEGDTA